MRGVIIAIAILIAIAAAGYAIYISHKNKSAISNFSSITIDSEKITTDGTGRLVLPSKGIVIGDLAIEEFGGGAAFHTVSANTYAPIVTSRLNIARDPATQTTDGTFNGGINTAGSGNIQTYGTWNFNQESRFDGGIEIKQSGTSNSATLLVDGDELQLRPTYKGNATATQILGTKFDA